jgi:hypothetical protein
MKKKILVILVFVIITNLTFVSLLAAGVCHFRANGCDYYIVDNGNGTGDAYINCDDGLIYYGSGSFGECPGDMYY